MSGGRTPRTPPSILCWVAAAACASASPAPGATVTACLQLHEARRLAREHALGCTDRRTGMRLDHLLSQTLEDLGCARRGW